MSGHKGGKGLHLILHRGDFVMINRIGGSSISMIPLEYRKGNPSAPFSRMLSDTRQSNETPSIHLYLRTEKTVYSGGIGEGYQTVYAEYTDDSTEEDPVVRILGKSSSGEYEFICRINDIDPTQASYAEMCALFGHLQKTGKYTSSPGIIHNNVLPHGINIGNVTQRQDYMNKINTMTTSQMFDQSNRDEAGLLLKLYQDFIRSNNIR